MIVFTKVRYKNFLATGNTPIEIVLNEHPTTLIVGKNGAGKSTMSEAICFALFGRPLRDINKPVLVNTINQRDCLVELWFTNGSNSYQIRRGIKPNIFEIYENGTLIPPPASVADYQTLLETSILHLNYKSFMQVVVLGSASYVPFMRLKASARRELIEDLLDIEVFSSMHALVKEDATNLRSEIDKLSHTTELLQEQKRIAEAFIAHLAEQNEQAVSALEEAVAKEQRELAALLRRKAEVEEALASYDSVRQQHDQAYKKQQEFERKLEQIESRARKIRKECAFYEEHDNCPTCAQPITGQFKDTRLAGLRETLANAAKAVAQCQALIRKYKEQAKAALVTLEETGPLTQELHTLEGKRPLIEKRIRELQAQIREARNPKQQETVDLDEIERKLADARQKLAAASARRVIVDAANLLLKDNGIKSRIIRHYLPIINKQINYYLTAMDFPVLFTLDEEFNEHIKSRHRDKFTYNSFSEGEKKRIDLAMLLTWRAVARLKNSASTNLLILDEVFDSSLDSSGTEEFLKIIAALESDTNVIVISHKTDQLVDKFANVITFEKHRGFSMVK